LNDKNQEHKLLSEQMGRSLASAKATLEMSKQKGYNSDITHIAHTGTSGIDKYGDSADSNASDIVMHFKEKNNKSVGSKENKDKLGVSAKSSKDGNIGFYNGGMSSHTAAMGAPHIGQAAEKFKRNKQEEIFGEGITYEGVWDEPKAFRGQTGAQDDIIPMQDIFSGVIFHYPQNDLTKYLLDLRAYRPLCVQRFFSDLAETMKEVHPKGLLGLLKDRGDVDALCFLIGILEEIYHFRNGHWQFVQKYIMSNTKYPKATGGTPITSWIPNQIMAVIIQMEEVLETINSLQTTDNHVAFELKDRNERMLSTKRKLLEGQLALIHQNDFSVESVFELNKKYGYEEVVPGSLFCLFPFYFFICECSNSILCAYQWSCGLVAF
jgi:hypothetical protein